MRFTDMKEILFDKAIEMIASIGFENMSMRDLAESAGIKGASIYNHFISKQEILDHIYDYYCRHLFDNRPSIDEAKHVIKDGSREEILKAITFNFVTDDEKKYIRMLLTTKIIMMRIFNDKEANRIFLQLLCAETADYVNELLKYGVSIGRLGPFDIETFTDITIGQFFFMGMKAFAQPDYVARQLEEEARIADMLLGYLPFKR